MLIRYVFLTEIVMLRLWIVVCLLVGPVNVMAQDKTSTERPEAKSPLKLTIEGDIDAELGPVAGNLTTLFYECYPKLLKRFENPNKPAPRHIRIIFDSKLRIPAHCSGNKVTVGVNWLKRHPEDFALLTHELTHAVQGYPVGDPGWITEGIADYARHLYGPKVQKNWALPSKLNDKQSYKDSYRTTGRFFLWLDGKHPGAVDKIHQAMQERKFELELFKTTTGKTVDELWKDCVGELKTK
jgi:hypothetical protein